MVSSECMIVYDYSFAADQAELYREIAERVSVNLT